MHVDMEMWNEVRHKVLVEGVAKRAACKQYGLGWETLEKILTHPELPGYRRVFERAKPKMDGFTVVLLQRRARSTRR